MNECEFRADLHGLLNRAAGTLDAQGLAFPLIDAAASIVVLASDLTSTSLEGSVEILRHRLDLSAVEARRFYNGL